MKPNTLAPQAQPTMVDEPPCHHEELKLELSVALSTVVSLLLDTGNEQPHVLDHVVNEEVIGMMQRASHTIDMYNGAQTQMDCNPGLRSTSTESKNTLQKLLQIQKERVDDRQLAVSGDQRESVNIHREFAATSSSNKNRQTYLFKRSYVRHQRKHCAAQPFECRACRKRFSSRARYRRHLRNCHRAVQFN
mmetsp:Transcript_75033/g.119313  ORF Transcript_75033/g.119313 Transcript_75033/m.119313 type:complete len:191 (-) Transcript_75033:358-930(-)